MELQIYQSLLEEIKTAICKAQIKAALAVNTEGILLYWQIGKMIAQRQAQEGWSAKVIPRLAKDLNNEFTEVKGYSERNLGYMLKFANEYPDLSILPQVVANLRSSRKPSLKAKAFVKTVNLQKNIPPPQFCNNLLQNCHGKSLIRKPSLEAKASVKTVKKDLLTVFKELGYEIKL